MRMEEKNDEISDWDRKLRWEVNWWQSPVNNEGTPWEGGFSSWPPDVVTITFEPAISILDKLEKLIPDYVKPKEGVEEVVYTMSRCGIAEQLLRARQQYRGENVDDYLTSPVFFQVIHETKGFLWTRPYGIERNGVKGGKEYIEKIDELITKLLGEEAIKWLNSPDYKAKYLDSP